MRVRVLGRVEVRTARDRPWAQPPPQQRLALALLVAQVGEVCRTEELQHALWAEDPPPSARRLLQALVSRLRQALNPSEGTDVLVTVPGGWRLDLDPADVDSARFEGLVIEGERLFEAGEADAAGRRLDEALELWLGTPFGEVADHPSLARERARLEERLLGALELSLRIRIRAGEVSDALADLSELVVEHPLRERLHGLRMEALYQAGRHGDALVAYQELRERLASELGAEPGPELQALHTGILRHDLNDDAIADPGLASVSTRTRPALSWPCRRDLPLVGRDAELSELTSALERARRGDRQLVLVAGEPGIGKTRLVAELADDARRRNAQVLVGRCTEGAAVPYQPFVEALRMDIEASDDTELRDRLGHHAGPLARLLPDLVERTGRRPPAASTNPQLDRHHLFDAVAGWARATAGHAPTLVVLEDLQWATRETLLLLRHLVRSTARERLTLVATYRDIATEGSTGLLDALAELARHPGVVRVGLGALRPQDVGMIVAARFRGSESRPARLAGQLYEATAGNSLFVQELLASTPMDAADIPRSGEDLQLPWSLRQLLDARIQELGEATLGLLEQAAVAGERFDFPLVTDAADQAQEAALPGLEEAIATRLVVPAEDAADRYLFGHAVMRQALLDRLSPSRRARLHARFAASLQRAHADHLDPVLAALAHHLAAAGPVADPTQTRRVLRATGDAAMGQLAYDEAAEHYRRALELLDDESKDPDVRRQRCDLLTALGDAQHRAGHDDDSDPLLRGLDLAVGLGDTDRIVRAAWAHNRGYPSHLLHVDEERVAALRRGLDVVGIDTPGSRAILLALLAGELAFPGPGIGADAEARRLSDEAVALARRADDTALARVLTLRQFTIQGPDTLAERLRDTAEVVQLADRLDDPTLRMHARQWRMMAAMEAGDRPEADGRLGEIGRLAGELGEPFLRATAAMLAASRDAAWGDLDEVPELASRAEELGLEAGAVDIQGVTTFQLFWYHRERGDVAEVLPRIERLRSRYGSMPHWQAMLAQAWWETGRHDEAGAVVEKFHEGGFAGVAGSIAGFHTLTGVAELASLTGHAPAAAQLLPLLEPYADQLDADQALSTGPVAHYLGLLATTLGDWEGAEAWLAQAARISERVGALRWSNRIGLARARLLLARGDPDDAGEARRLLAATASAAREAGQHAVAAEVGRVDVGDVRRTGS